MNTNPGDYLVIWVTGDPTKYIAEVTKSDPLEMKVMEQGPFRYLKTGDYIVLTSDTIRLQDSEDEANFLLKDQADRGFPLYSGLASLGVTDGTMRQMLPK